MDWLLLQDPQDQAGITSARRLVVSSNLQATEVHEEERIESENWLEYEKLLHDLIDHSFPDLTFLSRCKIMIHAANFSWS
jgi:hypothetical protein